MGRHSEVGWTDASWNSVRGCTRVSEECRNCYAELKSARFSRAGLPYEGYARMTPAGPRWTRRVDVIEKRLEDPIHWRQPKRIFVNDMSDSFHEALSDHDIGRIFGIMERAHWHDYQVLTKRSGRMRKFIRARYGGWPPPQHIWLGVSVGIKDSLPRIVDLRETPAAIRFLSIEPLLEPLGKINLDGIGWVIAGGESGPGYREMDPAWAREVRDQCVAAGIPFFFKQHGGLWHSQRGDDLDGRKWKQFPKPHPRDATKPSPSTAPLSDTGAQTKPPQRSWSEDLVRNWTEGATPRAVAAVRVLVAEQAGVSTVELNQQVGGKSGGAIVGGILAWATRRALPKPLVRVDRDGRTVYRFASEDLRRLVGGVLGPAGKG